MVFGELGDKYDRQTTRVLPTKPVDSTPEPQQWRPRERKKISDSTPSYWINQIKIPKSSAPNQYEKMLKTMGLNLSQGLVRKLEEGLSLAEAFDRAGTEQDRKVLRRFWLKQECGFTLAKPYYIDRFLKTTGLGVRLGLKDYK